MQKQWQEQFSYAYLRAVAAAAGFQVVKPEMDFCKVDLEISAIDERRHPTLPKLSLQVKSESDFTFQQDSLAYSLDIETYRRLAGDRTLHPRILVIVTVPKQQEDWLSQTQDALILRHCAYWKSLAGEPDSPNATAQTVYLPRAQVFDVPTLQRIMANLNRGVRP